ncbi:SLC25A15 [Cordylochernes scorpioides]|uniref:SLC25A15 n=1 Tax=Cordylochernes scorpioides TaxID=51811 RepID=A0ABY6LEK4_9ARAC|nr:SLC25A15 [Cordylochernes scorpioides]
MKSNSQSPENLTYYQRLIVSAIDLTAGSLGGVAVVAVGQPLDTVKVKMQTFPQLYRTSWNCFLRTTHNEGVRGLYAGTVPAIVANVAENSVVFAAYGVCQRIIQNILQKNTVEELTPFENASAGFFAAFFSSLTLCPTELVKCRLQAINEIGLASKNQLGVQCKLGPWSLTKQIIKSEGIPGLYRGFSSTVFREMPGYFFFFGGYEATLCLLNREGRPKQELNPLILLLSGGVGGVSLWLSIYPFDVVKSRIQVENLKTPMFTVMRKIINNEGPRALFKGLGPTLLRTFPTSGALFLTFEYSKWLMHYLSGIPQ